MIEGQFKPSLVESDDLTELFEPGGKPVVYGGSKYVEFPNSTAMTTTDSVTGATREFLLTRGVKPYLVRSNKSDGSMGPQGYVSDVLLFELVAGKAVFRSRLLASAEEKGFFFEDPRISTVVSDDGRIVYYLSGTDYSSHVPGSTNLDVMNRYVELKTDRRGLPLPVAIDSVTGKPDFSDLSPVPTQTRSGSWSFVDAKNGTIAQNEKLEIVVRTRLRPDFNDPSVQSLAGGQSWKYAEQVFVFKNWDHFKAYNWNDSLIDVFGKRDTEPTSSSVAPLTVKTIIQDTQLTEKLKSSKPNVQIAPEKGKGLGPGTRPLRIRRDGDKIYISDGPRMKEFYAGTIRSGVTSIKSGDVIFVTFDHEIRYFKQKVGDRNLIRRHYSASLKFFDSTLTNLIDYRADVIQPRTRHERGLNSGILDLQHVYPMGYTIAVNARTGVARARVIGGQADAHTGSYLFDIVKLLEEEVP